MGQATNTFAASCNLLLALNAHPRVKPESFTRLGNGGPDTLVSSVIGIPMSRSNRSKSGGLMKSGSLAVQFLSSCEGQKIIIKSISIEEVCTTTTRCIATKVQNEREGKVPRSVVHHPPQGPEGT